ncbi:unnamed protein product [Rhizophagus irregularis]|nr:unnamed protein product [Rhizophagus irregularis]
MIILKQNQVKNFLMVIKSARLRFIQEDDDDIKKYMKEFGHLSNCYALISEKMGNKINPKRIYQRWTNNLNPNLCHDSFNDNEKSFINEWVEEYKIRNPSSRSISLKEIIPVMKEKFGKLRSVNQVKNFWHTQQRKKGRNTSQGPSQNGNLAFDKLKKSLKITIIVLLFGSQWV